MQDYNINVNYNVSSDIKETNVKKTKTFEDKKTVPKTQRKSNVRGLQKSVGAGLGVASRINSYVGALTENNIQQRNTQTTLTFALMGAYALKNPARAVLGATAYIADRLVQYEIKQYKTNLSAGFMSRLSGGLYNK